mgnify:CR=1 FL=1
MLKNIVGEHKGKKIIHFEAGQPTAKLPNKVYKKAINIIKTTNVSYTSPLGMDLLRKRISKFYLKKYKLNFLGMLPGFTAKHRLVQKCAESVYLLDKNIM